MGVEGVWEQNELEMVKLRVNGRYGALEGGFSAASLPLYLSKGPGSA